jgi:hypothetical protein
VCQHCTSAKGAIPAARSIASRPFAAHRVGAWVVMGGGEDAPPGVPESVRTPGAARVTSSTLHRRLTSAARSQHALALYLVCHMFT